jgi:uncharacterized protein (DUF2225 family)
MTMMSEREVTCCVCGTKSSHMGIGSTNTSGSPDLDTRPPEMMRSTICYWIERCPSCGYSSSSLSECDGDVRDIVESKEYQYILENKSLPEIAASFMASSYVKQEQQKYSESAWSAIRAAWVCDDRNNYEASRECRRKSVSLIKMANEKEQVVADQVGASEAITLDLMRRAGMFQEALDLVKETKKMDIEEVVRKVISYQEKLVRSKDTDAHTISEALGEE